jgi:SNF family Na+-dependent transporter
MIDDELKKVNVDIIFFFLFVVATMTSFYIIIEKKKSILDIGNVDADKINALYHGNRKLIFVIWIYFLVNAYLAFKNEENEDNMWQDKLLLLAAIFGVLSASCYLPLGNSNVVINR